LRLQLSTRLAHASGQHHNALQPDSSMLALKWMYADCVRKLGANPGKRLD